MKRSIIGYHKTIHFKVSGSSPDISTRGDVAQLVEKKHRCHLFFILYLETLCDTSYPTYNTFTKDDGSKNI